MLKRFFPLLILITLFAQSCATSNQDKAPPMSSKFVYSVMTKDHVALNSIFSDNLKRSLKGEMLLKAIKSAGKGEMKGIEFVESKGNMASYNVQMSEGSFPLKVEFDEGNRVDNVWINKKKINR